MRMRAIIEATYKLRPTGGWHRPTSMFTSMTMPKCTRSMPNRFAAGARIGAMIKMIEFGSMKLPAISRSTLIEQQEAEPAELLRQDPIGESRRDVLVGQHEREQHGIRNDVMQHRAGVEVVGIQSLGRQACEAKAGYAKPRLPWLESLLSFCTGCGSKAANSSGDQRRLLISLHSRTAKFPLSSGSQRPCRDAGVGAIALGLAMLDRAKRASHIDPPASSYAIMRRTRPTAERTLYPARMFAESLTPRPELVAR